MATKVPTDESVAEVPSASSDSVSGDNDDLLRHLQVKWKQIADREKQFVIVTAGKAGVGKSTLVNNFLELEGDDAFEARLDPNSVTTSVDHCDKEIRRVHVRVIDMPGFHAPDPGAKIDKKRNILGDIKVLTGKGVDVVFYCINLMNRLEQVDYDHMATLTKLFGQEIWEHTIFVFTYTDFVVFNGKSPQELVDKHIEELQKYLIREGKKGVNVKIRSIYSFSTEFKDLIDFKGIVGIPVSKDPDVPENWQNNLTALVLLKGRKENIPAIMKLTSMYIDWHEVKKALKVTAKGATFGGAWGSAIGAGVGGIAGAVATAPIGGVGGLATAAAGAAIGAWIGTVGGTTITGVSVLCTRIVYVIHSRQNIIKKAQQRLETKEKGESPAPETSGPSQDEAEL